MPETSVSIIIPTYNRESVLCDTLDGLRKLDPKPAEVLVIDQTLQHSSAVETYLSEANRGGWIRWIQTEVPSLPRARNLGVREAIGEVVLFLDDDVAVDSGLIRKHQELYENESYVAVCGQVLQPRRYESSMEKYFSLEELDGEKFNRLSFNQRAQVDILRGCHFSVRREVFLGVGGFDEAFVGAANGEESDFANRLVKVGKRIIFDPDCFVVHWKIPSGGCRIVGNQTIPEWKKTASMLLYGLRYFSSREARANYLWASLRSGPFRRENLVHMWRLPAALFAYGRALLHALLHAWRKPLNSIQ